MAYTVLDFFLCKVLSYFVFVAYRFCRRTSGGSSSRVKMAHYRHWISKGTGFSMRSCFLIFKKRFVDVFLFIAYPTIGFCWVALERDEGFSTNASGLFSDQKGADPF